MVSPVEQAKKHILSVLRQSGPEVKEIIYPCLAIDAQDYHRALWSSEVSAEFAKRRIHARIVPVESSNDPTIVIATVNDVINKKSDNLLGR